MSEFAVYYAERVEELLDYAGCIRAVRTAMAALARDTREQPLRNIVTIDEGQLFGLMPGVADQDTGFGAKVISAFEDPASPGRAPHQGVVVLFDRASGSPLCVADAHEVTKIRTACASAAATDALARPEASTLAIFGCGTQAEAHIRAIPLVRPIERIAVWGRTPETAQSLVERLQPDCPATLVVERDPRAAARADIVCTVTGASEPILKSSWVGPGTHVNAVGSSHAGPVEIDPHLVAASRYIVDYRRSALDAAAEFLRARDQGLVDDAHIKAEIGEVYQGAAAGREDPQQITLYKSLGHIVQDLAATRYVHSRAVS